jgi:hypothetical protein
MKTLKLGRDGFGKLCKLPKKKVLEGFSVCCTDILNEEVKA